MWIECKKAIKCPMMIISSVIAFVILLRVFFLYNLFNTQMDYLTMLTYPLTLSGFLPFAAVFAVLPYAFSYLEEKNSGYVAYIITRSGKRKYITSKLLTVGLSGGVAEVLPFVLIAIVILINGESVTVSDYPEVYIGRIWETYMFMMGGKVVLLMRLVLIFMFGIFWAEVALLISVLYSNRYVVFVVTFVCSQFMWMILPPGINMFYLFRADFSRETMHIYTPYLIECVYILMVCVVTYILIKKD